MVTMSGQVHNVCEPKEIEVALLWAQSSQDQALVLQLTSLINEVYAVAEKGLWLNNATRCTSREVAKLIEGEQIAVARLGSQIVGCVRIQKLDENTGEFGMLAARADIRGIGVGRKLIAFAESLSKARGLGTMQLELLVPRTWTLESKEFLKSWYARLGYQKVRNGNVDEELPSLAPLLATPCDFLVYHKSL